MNTPHRIPRIPGVDIDDVPTPAELAAEARMAEGETAAGFTVRPDRNREAF